MDLIEFPDPVTLAGEYLQRVLTARGETARVGSSLPPAQKGPGPRTPWIRLLAGSGASAGAFMADADLIVEAYADGEAEAYRLASLARAVITFMAAEPRTGVHKLMGAGLPQEMETATGFTRFTFTATIRITALPRSS